MSFAAHREKLYQSIVQSLDNCEFDARESTECNSKQDASDRTETESKFQVKNILGKIEQLEIEWIIIDDGSTDETKKICGYLCNCVKVTFPDNGNKRYKIWYTKEINIKDPNKSTPYEQIDGVLMDFVFLFDNVEMHFSAENVYDMKIDDDIFERKTNFIKTDKSDIIDFIYKMLSF